MQRVSTTEYSHELVITNEDLPFKMFLFEGKDGNYFRDKHWHRSVEIFAVFDGEMDFFLNDVCCPLRAGEFLLVNSNEIHSIHAPNPNKTIVLQIPLDTFADYFTGEQYICFSHGPQELDKRLMELIAEMYETYEKHECGYDMKVKGLYYTMLYLIVTEYRELETSEEMVSRNRNLERLSVITSYIKKNYASGITLDELAKFSGYSPWYLSRMFHKYAGINFKSYLQNVCLENAYRELMNSDHTLSEIALRHGFSGSDALAKVFQKKYGMLPSEYRKRCNRSTGTTDKQFSQKATDRRIHD